VPLKLSNESLYTDAAASGWAAVRAAAAHEAQFSPERCHRALKLKAKKQGLSRLCTHF
jgi:NAD-dependent SIR2 family protein deacetylase